MKRIILSTLVVLLAAGLGWSTAHAETVTGVVQSINNTTVVIRTDDGQTKTIQLQSGVTRPSDIDQGNRVTVNYDMAGGQMVASSITMAVDQSQTSRTNMSSQNNSQTNTTDRYGDNGSLPRTASPMAALLVWGLLALSGGFLMRRIRV